MADNRFYNSAVVIYDWLLCNTLVPLCLRLLGEKKKKKKKPSSSPSFVPLKRWIWGFKEFDVGQVSSHDVYILSRICKQELVAETKKKKRGRNRWRSAERESERERERKRDG